MNKDFIAVDVGRAFIIPRVCGWTLLGLIMFGMIAGCAMKREDRAEVLYCIGACIQLEAERSTEGKQHEVDTDCAAGVAEGTDCGDGPVQQ